MIRFKETMRLKLTLLTNASRSDLQFESLNTFMGLV